MILTFLLILAIIAVSVSMLSIRVILLRNGRFGAKHIGQSREMRKRGITCVQSMDAMERAKKADNN